MNIGIDIKSAIGKKAGIGYYTEGIVKALSKIDEENEYSLFTTEKIDWNLGRNFHQIIRGNEGITRKFLWYAKLWIDIFIKNKVQVIFHGTLSDTIDGRFPSDHMPVLTEVIVE